MSRMRVKPSKSQSVMGFVVGICFVIFGLTTVIKIGAFGLLWTGLAVVITVMHGINLFTDRGISTMTIEDAETGKDVEAGKGVEARLRKLDHLRDQRLITDEEYEITKINILKDL